jgi:pimeloyl-ACP methyl ester carboxylesterase
MTVRIRKTPISRINAIDSRHLRVALCAFALALPGCKSTPAPPADPEATLQAAAEGGYAVHRRYDTATVHDTWLDGETPLDVSFIGPTARGAFPLIIYMPGLGETASAGVLWRQAWAEAGYAVLAVQSETFAAAFRSERARAGDFQGLAKENFSIRSLTSRLEQLHFVLDETRRRSDAHVAPYSSIDSGHVALAGFDLGAQTAAAGLDEKAMVAPARAGQAIRAAILLSPYLDPAPGDVSKRLAAINVPVLSITGTEDADPLGLIASPALRRVPWQSMPVGDKYLLLLSAGTHGLLAGTRLSELGTSGAETNQSKGGDSRSDSGRRSRRGGAGSAAPPPGESGEVGRGNRTARPFNVRQIAAVRSVTTAFLDATMKDDPAARRWLAEDAGTWLEGSGKLQVR